MPKESEHHPPKSKIEAMEIDVEEPPIQHKRQPRPPVFSEEAFAEFTEDEIEEARQQSTWDDKLQEYLKTAMACGLSKNGAMKMYTASLLLFDDYVPSDMFMARSTISRKVDEVFKTKVDQHAEEAKGIVNFGYDGRKDLTLQPKQKLKRESHITFVGDDGEYLNHTTMENDEGEEIAGTAENLAQKIFDVLEETESVDTVTFISSDGTNVNTGHEGNFDLFFHEYQFIITQNLI